MVQCYMRLFISGINMCTFLFAKKKYVAVFKQQRTLVEQTSNQHLTTKGHKEGNNYYCDIYYNITFTNLQEGKNLPYLFQ